MPEAFTIQGIEETIEMLKNAPRRVVATGYLKAGQAAGNVIKDAVEARTPVEHGDLKAALLMEVTLDSDFRGVSVDIGFGKQGHVANFVETFAETLAETLTEGAIKDVA